MSTIVNLYSTKKNEIKKFLEHYYNYNKNIEVKNEDLEWKKEFDNPIEMAEIIGTLIDNNDKYQISMWISLDSGVLINVTEYNSDDIIRYLYERYPY